MGGTETEVDVLDVHVAVAQLGPTGVDEPRAHVVARMSALLEDAAGRGARLVAFPELAFTPYFPKALPTGDVDHVFETSVPGTQTAPLFERAVELGVCLYLGYAELTPVGERFNTAVLTDELGQVRSRYRKIHLPGLTEPAPPGEVRVYEPLYFSPGTEPNPVHHQAGWGLGLALCQDRRFPETYRNLALAGADIALAGFNTPLSSALSLEQHLLSIRAGCYQSSLYGLFPAKSGVEGGVRMLDASCIVDPHGQVIAMTSGPGDAVIDARLRRDELTTARARWGFIDRRRPGQYRTKALRAG